MERSNWRSLVKPDNLKETLEYDRYEMGIFKTNQVVDVQKVSYQQIYYNVREDKSNSIKVKIIGKRKIEVGLVLPATFIAHT